MRGILPNGNEILAIRVARGLNQRELAELAKLDIKTIRKAEQSIRLDVISLRRIAETLNVDHQTLLQNIPANGELHQEIVAKWCERFDNHDLPGLLELYHPDAVLQIPGGADIRFGGTYRGREQIGQSYQANWNATRQEPINLDDCSFLIAEEGITLQGEKGIYLPNGKLLYFSCVQVFSFRQGLIIRHEVHFDTLEFAKRMEAELRGIPGDIAPATPPANDQSSP